MYYKNNNNKAWDDKMLLLLLLLLITVIVTGIIIMSGGERCKALLKTLCRCEYACTFKPKTTTTGKGAVESEQNMK